jgi:SRSO17 transposase
MALPAQAWRNVAWREGSNNELSGRFAGVRVRPAHRDYLASQMRAEEWLLIEWSEGEAEPTKYFLTTAPEEATLAQMVFVTKMRWRIERDYQDLKQDFGLGHYEGRGWRGFHHHATLSIAAYGFLMAERLKAGNSASSKKNFAQRQVPVVPPGCQNSCRLRFFAGYPHRSDISCTENLIHITPPNSKNRRCLKPGIAARVQFKALPTS